MTIVLDSDFEQIFSVIMKDLRYDIVVSSINSFALWTNCTAHRLIVNMRLGESSLPAG